MIFKIRKNLLCFLNENENDIIVIKTKKRQLIYNLQKKI